MYLLVFLLAAALPEERRVSARRGGRVRTMVFLNSLREITRLY